VGKLVSATQKHPSLTFANKARSLLPVFKSKSWLTHSPSNIRLGLQCLKVTNAHFYKSKLRRCKF